MSKQKTAYHEECQKWSIRKWSFKIDNSGLANVRGHAGTDGHKSKVKVISGTTSQRVIMTNNDSKISQVVTKTLLSTEDQVNRAEALP